jgi:hypothetical protein
VSSDPSNCGQCGKVCATTDSCSNSTCTPNYSWTRWPIPPDGPTNYTDNKNGTVNDNVTGLVWQQAPVPAGYTWQAGKDYCAALTLAGGGWRLPSRIELVSLVDFTKYNPSINAAFFPSTPAAYFWSSSPNVSSAGNLWVVDFHYGNSGYGTGASAYVRCVR